MWPSVRQIRFCRFFSGCRQVLSERIAECNQNDGAFGLHCVLGRSYPNIHIDSARFVFVFQRVTVFIGDGVKADHWFLGGPSAKSESAFRQGTAFFRLCPGEVSYFCFSFCEVFTREARNNLAQPVKVDALEGFRIKAFRHQFPRFTAKYDCAKMPVSIGT